MGQGTICSPRWKCGWCPPWLGWISGWGFSLGEISKITKMSKWRACISWDPHFQCLSWSWSLFALRGTQKIWFVHIESNLQDQLHAYNFTGLHFGLSLADLILSPSRLARLCLGFRAFALAMERRMWPECKHFLHDGYTFAIEWEDHVKFSNSLHVYGKKLVWTSHYMGVLITEAMLRIQVSMPSPTAISSYS